MLGYVFVEMLKICPELFFGIISKFSHYKHHTVNFDGISFHYTYHCYLIAINYGRDNNYKMYN